MEIFAQDCRRKLSLSTASIKIATVLIYTVLILHLVGFSLPYWLKIVWIHADIGDTSFDTEKTEFVGLWQNCSRNSSQETSDIDCVSKPAFTGSDVSLFFCWRVLLLFTVYVFLFRLLLLLIIIKTYKVHSSLHHEL